MQTLPCWANGVLPLTLPFLQSSTRTEDTWSCLLSMWEFIASPLCFLLPSPISALTSTPPWLRLPVPDPCTHRCSSAAALSLQARLNGVGHTQATQHSPDSSLVGRNPTHTSSYHPDRIISEGAAGKGIQKNKQSQKEGPYPNNSKCSKTQMQGCCLFQCIR